MACATCSSSPPVGPSPVGSSTVLPSDPDPSSGDASPPPTVADAGVDASPAAVDGAANSAPDGAPTKTGIEGFCEHYIACGGSTYPDVASCITDGVSYWGPCRRALLDAFGTCMTRVPCSEWNPAAYDPLATPCADPWRSLRDAPACK